METNSEAIDLLPPSSAQPARVLAMQGGTVLKKLECTWNMVLIVRHDGYPDPKRFLYLHLQNGTSPVGTGTVIHKGQYLGDLRTPVFNGYSSNGSCTTQGSGAFDCERDNNPSTGNLCSYSTARHLHLGFGTDRSITIDGNVVGKLVLGGHQERTGQKRRSHAWLRLYAVHDDPGCLPTQALIERSSVGLPLKSDLTKPDALLAQRRCDLSLVP